ncbi:MAG: hypothetical protein ACRD1U_18100, partial [Vicinamibacterales bacterium]
NEAAVFDIRPATAWVNDIQNATLVEGAKHFRGQNPPRGTAISYWLKSAVTEEVRIVISDVSGREVRALDGPQEAGLHRVQWDIALGGGRGRGGRGGAGGGQAQGTRGTGARGRGGFGGLTVPPGTYLVKVMVGDKVIGQKTATVEMDSLH